VPYRNRATVESWLNDWLVQQGLGTEITVLDDSFEPGENSAVVVVSLRGAPTITHLRPVPRDGAPCWVATFEPRDELIELDQARLLISRTICTCSESCCRCSNARPTRR